MCTDTREKYSCAQGHVAVTLGHTNTELHSCHPNPDGADLLQTTTKKSNKQPAQNHKERITQKLNCDWNSRQLKLRKPKKLSTLVQVYTTTHNYNSCTALTKTSTSFLFPQQDWNPASTKLFCCCFKIIMDSLCHPHIFSVWGPDPPNKDTHSLKFW